MTKGSITKKLKRIIFLFGSCVFAMAVFAISTAAQTGEPNPGSLAGDWRLTNYLGNIFCVQLKYDAVEEKYTLSPQNLVSAGDYIFRSSCTPYDGSSDSCLVKVAGPNPSYPCWVWKIVNNDQLENLPTNLDSNGTPNPNCTYNYYDTEMTRLTDTGDDDGDGVYNGCDNCPTTSNSGQEDADNDGAGDVCEGIEDFSGNRIDHSRWADGEFVRRINGGVLESQITRYGSPGSNNLLFTNPGEVRSFDADVTVIDMSANDFNPKARLGGQFYDDGTPGEGQTGDIFAEIGIRNTDSDSSTGLAAYYYVMRCEDAGCKDYTMLTYEEPEDWGPVQLGETHHLSIDWDQAHTFTFGFDDHIATYLAPPKAAPAALPIRLIGTKVSNIGPGEGGFISATFDNVTVNGDQYDVFAGPLIDKTKWNTWEFVRRVQNGVLESAIARYYTNGSNYLNFIYPQMVNGFQADVTVTDFGNSLSYPVAKLAGAFFKDLSYTGPGRVGDVFADVGIYNDGDELWPFWNVVRCTKADCNPDDAKVWLDSGGFGLGHVAISTPHTISMMWDEASSTFTFGFDGASASYVYPPTPLGKAAVTSPVKGLATRIAFIDPGSEDWGYINAEFDNVVVSEAVDNDGDGIPDSFDNCPAVQNADQLDTDRDGLGDVCDDDDDNDTILDSTDNCRLVFNLDQANRDNDNFGDACDNCPDVANDQTDTDGDGLGNACENYDETVQAPAGTFNPAEPLWVTATFYNKTTEPLQTIRPDCFNTTFTVKDPSGNILPPRYRMRAAYGIPADVVSIPPGPFTVTCDLTENFDKTVLTSGSGGSAKSYSVVATHANDIQDPDINASGNCIEPSGECYPLWTGAVSSVPATVTIKGQPATEMVADVVFNPVVWYAGWASSTNQFISAAISNVKDREGNTYPVADIVPETIRLNGSVRISGTEQIDDGVMTVQFDRVAAVESLGSLDLERQVHPIVQGALTDSDEKIYGYFTGTRTVYLTEAIVVEIDIKPGSFPNSINLGSNGNVPVAILSSAEFDATTIDPGTVTLADAQVKVKGKGNRYNYSHEDINGDGRLDLMVHIDTQGLALSKGDTSAVLKGFTYDSYGGNPVMGSDSVRIVKE